MHIGNLGLARINQDMLYWRILFCRADENAQDLQLVLEVNQSLLALVHGAAGLGYLASPGTNELSVLVQSA